MGSNDVKDTLTQSERRDVLADVVAHREPPTKEELQYTTGFKDDHIEELLATLTDHDLIKEVSAPDDETTYAVTDEARTLFDENGVFVEEHWQEVLDQVK